MSDFDELASSRRAWIDDVLTPWCRSAPRAELVKAEAEWPNLAGQVDPEQTLWTWAWSRFPELVHDGLSGVNETCEVEIVLNDGRSLTGFPDNRESRQGRLVLLVADGAAETVSIDDVTDVRRK